MFKFVVILATISCTLAAPKPDPSLALAAPLVTAPAIAPAVVTAQSSQVIARNYNALAAPLVAPYVRAAPLVAPAPLVRAAAPLLGAPAPYLAGPAPYVAAPSPYFASPYLANPYAAPFVL